jgi:Dolichyl-phosphate-mannose-protein mannosyltransferase
MTPRRLLFLFLGALTFLRLIYIGQIELSPDEAYYFEWSQHLDWSYFSKGPGIALALWLSTHLFGDTVFGVRVFSPLLALGTSIIMFRFVRRLYGESPAIWTVLLMNLIPIFHAGALVMTIDPLSIFFWMAAMAAFWRALEKGPAFSFWWPLTGALIGCGFLAKYTNAMQLLSILLLIGWTPRFRREFRGAGLYALFGVFALFTIPVIVWNANHAWITLIHLKARGGFDDGPRLRPGDFFVYLLLHLGVYSPLIFTGMLAALAWAWKKGQTHLKPRFLLAFTLPLLLMYFGLAFKKAGEPNWTGPAMLSLAILAVVFWLERASMSVQAGRFAVAAMAIGALMSLLTADPEMVRRLGFPLSYDRDPTARLRGWQTAAETVESFRKKFEAEHGGPVFLIANKYQTAATLGFYLSDKRLEAPGHPPIYSPVGPFPENQFYYWHRYDEDTDFTEVADEVLHSPASHLSDAVRDELAASLDALPGASSGNDGEKDAENRRRFLRALKAAAPEIPIDTYYTASMGFSRFAGRDALYITDRGEERPAPEVEGGFTRSEMVACFDFNRRGLPLRQIRIFACYGYRQPEL